MTRHHELPSVVALKAMGVLYRHGDVVTHLLVHESRADCGVIDVLEHLTSAGLTLACLTDDTAEWSAILRRRFGLDPYTGHWFVSTDAGYCDSPLTGQGTAMALVGAYVLAGELAAHADDIPVPLDRYGRCCGRSSPGPASCRRAGSPRWRPGRSSAPG